MSGSRAIDVVKVGGSLVSDGARLRVVLARLAGEPAVIVPGGGPFADAVRASQSALGFDDALAHRLALDAMGRMARVFRGIEPRLRLAETVEAAGLAAPCIWDPAALKAGRPEIPESWDVTSDSLALWLATALEARRCVLFKSAPCPEGASPEELARLGLVDRAFPDFARRFRGEIVVEGPERPSPPHPASREGEPGGPLQSLRREAAA